MFNTEQYVSAQKQAISVESFNSKLTDRIAGSLETG